MEKEIMRLRKITNSETASTNLLKTLNRVLLTGASPLIIITILESLEENSRMRFQAEDAKE